MPKQSLREATDKLEAFAATTTIAKTSSAHNTTPKKLEQISPINLEGSGIQPKAVANPDIKHIHHRPMAQALHVVSDISRSTGAFGPLSIAAYLKEVPKKRRRRWESATVIMERILDDKVSEAPTSIMSANTSSMVSQSHPVLRWNDKYYSYLPHYVANGNVNAVRKMNGRTPLHYVVEKPLWSGYSSVIYILLAAKAGPKVRDKSNDVPLLMLLAGGGPLSQEKRDALPPAGAKVRDGSRRVCPWDFR